MVGGIQKSTRSMKQYVEIAANASKFRENKITSVLTAVNCLNGSKTSSEGSDSMDVLLIALIITISLFFFTFGVLVALCYIVKKSNAVLTAGAVKIQTSLKEKDIDVRELIQKIGQVIQDAGKPPKKGLFGGS